MDRYRLLASKLISTVVDSGGVSNFSRNVLLRQVTTDSAWRNGLSVISAINLTVVDSIFKNTNGTNPQCGIDLEPDHPTDKLQQIELRNIKLLTLTVRGRFSRLLVLR